MQNFITRNPATGRLMDGSVPFEKFLSVNVPNLMGLEKTAGPSSSASPAAQCLNKVQNYKDITAPTDYPSLAEIQNGMVSVRQMGAQVLRTYVFSMGDLGRPVNRHILDAQFSTPADCSSYVLVDVGAAKTEQGNQPFLNDGKVWLKINKHAFGNFDLVMRLVADYDLRIIVPFIDNYSFWGGIPQLYYWANKACQIPSQADTINNKTIWDGDTWMTSSNPGYGVAKIYLAIIHYILNRLDFSGIPYKQNKSILAWETGNELGKDYVNNKWPVLSIWPSRSWTALVSRWIKDSGAQQLVVDGAMGLRGPTVGLQIDQHSNNQPINQPDQAGPIPWVDIVSNHYYPDAKSKPLAFDSVMKTDLQTMQWSRDHWQTKPDVKAMIVGEFGQVPNTSTAVSSWTSFMSHIKSQSPDFIAGACAWALEMPNSNLRIKTTNPLVSERVPTSQAPPNGEIGGFYWKQEYGGYWDFNWPAKAQTGVSCSGIIWHLNGGKPFAVSTRPQLFPLQNGVVCWSAAAGVSQYQIELETAPNQWQPYQNPIVNYGQNVPQDGSSVSLVKGIQLQNTPAFTQVRIKATLLDGQLVYSNAVGAAVAVV